jgi:hypothetical protein
MKYLLVFVAGFVSDWVWAAYIAYTAERRPLHAAALSGIIMVLGAYVTVSYLEDPSLLVVAVLGGMLGTYVFVKRKT